HLVPDLLRPLTTSLMEAVAYRGGDAPCFIAAEALRGIASRAAFFRRLRRLYALAEQAVHEPWQIEDRPACGLGLALKLPRILDDGEHAFSAVLLYRTFRVLCPADLTQGVEGLELAKELLLVG